MVYVKTLDGTLRGFSSTILQKQVLTFLGIPFAKPPVSDLRFRPPSSVTPWDGIKDATKPSPTCIQPLPEKWQMVDPMTRVWLNTTEMSEDCLYLNIWTNAINGTSQPPGLAFKNAEDFTWPGRGHRSPSMFQQLNGRPVMVWIHGGNLVSGSASLEIYNGAILASEMGVIVVSIQYRLGPLGFLHLGTPGIPGNQGLLDQVEALHWIRRNIVYFGGNPEQISLFGHGAGALSASLHLLSPMSGPLFQQAILQSGSPLSWWSAESAQTATNKARLYARISGCNGNEDEMEACLRSVEAGTLVINQWKMHLSSDLPSTIREHRISRLYNRRYNPEVLHTAGIYFNITFRPVVVAPFLPRWPYQVIGSNRETLRHRVLLGVNKDESTFELIHGLRKYFLKEHHTPQIPTEFASDRVVMDPLDILAFYIIDEDFLHPFLLQATAFEYQIPSRAFYRKQWTSEEVYRALANAAGDYSVKCPLIEFADAYSQGRNSQVFQYSFEHHSSGWTWPNWTGVMQGYEMEYVFGAPLNLKFESEFYKFTDEERQLSAIVMQFWANFAATGSPSLHPGEFHTRNKRFHWNNYETHTTTFKDDVEGDTSREYLVIELPKPKLSRNLRRHECLFWREKLPMLRQRLVSNARCYVNLTKESETTPSKSSGSEGTPFNWNFSGSHLSTSGSLVGPLNLFGKILATCMFLSSLY